MVALVLLRNLAEAVLDCSLRTVADHHNLQFSRRQWRAGLSRGKQNIPLVASAVGAGASSFFSSFFIIPSNSLVILLKNDMMDGLFLYLLRRKSERYEGT